MQLNTVLDPICLPSGVLPWSCRYMVHLPQMTARMLTLACCRQAAACRMCATCVAQRSAPQRWQQHAYAAAREVACDACAAACAAVPAADFGPPTVHLPFHYSNTKLPLCNFALAPLVLLHLLNHHCFSSWMSMSIFYSTNWGTRWAYCIHNTGYSHM